MSDKVSCKSCKYVKFNWKNPFSWGTPFAYKCTRHLVDEIREWNPVTGTVDITEVHYENCSTNRRDYGPCGPEGKNWEPKNKKDLFKYIKRI